MFQKLVICHKVSLLLVVGVQLLEILGSIGMDNGLVRGKNQGKTDNGRGRRKKIVPQSQRKQRKDTNQNESISTWSMLHTKEEEVKSARAGQLGVNK